MAARAKSPEEFERELAQAAPDIELLDAYVNARTKVACRCRECGCTWQATPNHLLRGAGCPQCAGTARTSPETFAARIAASAPEIELVSPYVNARTRIECRCRVCGHAWSPYPKSLLQGYGCPECGKKRGKDAPVG